MATESTRINKNFSNDNYKSNSILDNPSFLDHIHDNDNDNDNNYNYHQDNFLIINLKNQLNDFLIYLENFYFSIDDFIIFNNNLIQDSDRILNFINNKILIFYDIFNTFSDDDKDIIYDMYLSDIDSYFLKIEIYINKFLKNN
jgi:hypothetical protein